MLNSPCTPYVNDFKRENIYFTIYRILLPIFLKFYIQFLFSIYEKEIHF